MLTRIFPAVFAIALCCHSSGWSDDRPGQPTQALARIGDSGQLELRAVVSKPVYETAMATRQFTQYEVRTVTTKKKQIVDGKEVFVDVQHEEKVPVTKEESYTYTVSKSVPVEMPIEFALDEKKAGFEDMAHEAIPIFEIDGRPAKLDTVRSRLKSWTLVLITDNGRAAPSYYADLFKPGTLQVALPRSPASYGVSAGRGMAPSVLPVPVPSNPAPAPLPPRAIEADPNAATSSLLERPTSLQLTALQSAAPASDGEIQIPPGLPPAFTFAQVNQKSITLRTSTERVENLTTMCTEEVSETHNGQTVKKLVCRPVQVEHTVRNHDIATYPVDAVRVLAIGGEELEARDLETRLRKETTVIVSTNGRDVDSFWLQNVKPGTMVVIAPVLQQHAPMAMPPAMAAPAPPVESDSPPPAAE